MYPSRWWSWNTTQKIDTMNTNSRIDNIKDPVVFERLMKEIEDRPYPSDEDDKHRDADKLTANLLIKLGYSDGVKVFLKMDKWYS